MFAGRHCFFVVGISGYRKKRKNQPPRKSGAAEKNGEDQKVSCAPRSSS